MTAPETANADADALLPPGMPEDWRMPHDVPCPSCRYNLRTQRTPRCPECGLVFRWQAVLHCTCARCGQYLHEEAGAHCNACGIRLSWAALFDAYDPRSERHFEYTERPIRAGAGVLLRSLWITRFWRRSALETPPAPARLRALRRTTTAFLLAGAAAQYAGLATDSAQQAAGMLMIAAIPPVVTAIALPLFAPTLARFRVRRDQLLRVSTYLSCGLFWLGLALAVHALVCLLIPVPPWRAAHAVNLPVALAVQLTGGWYHAAGLWFDPGLSNGLFWIFSVGAAWWLVGLLAALRIYLRLPARATVFLFASTQMISLLVVILALGLLPVYHHALGVIVLGWSR